MIRVFLIGFMGAGKTSFGRLLAQELNLSFYDLDHSIESKCHKSIGEIFAEKGEDGFRRLERQVLDELSALEDVVIATGGGAPCFFDNMESMNSLGTTIYLAVPNALLLKRLLVDRAKRPLLKGKTDEEVENYLSMLVKKRLPFYQQAKFEVEASTIKVVADMKACLVP